jgi:hypothetical protein
MHPRARFSLPAGWLDQNGAREHGVELRALCGADEEWIHSLPGETRQVSVAAALLTRCLRRIGARRASPAMIRELTVGDTDFLLLRLWELTFGHRVELVLQCPRGACGAKMDVDFTLRAVPIEPCPQLPSYTVRFPDGPVRAVDFRLPRLGDLEEIDSRSAETLLDRCLLSIDDQSELDPAGPRSLPAELRAAIEAEMERVSATAHGEIEAECAECGAAFTIALEPMTWLLSEVARRRREFEADVHLLSFHYHWPLRDILSMPRAQRQHYVRLLLEQIDRAPGVPPASEPVAEAWQA